MRRTDYMWRPDGGGGKPSAAMRRKYLRAPAGASKQGDCDQRQRTQFEGHRTRTPLIEKPRSAWPKENRSLAQPQINGECAQLLLSDLIMSERVPFRQWISAACGGSV